MSLAHVKPYFRATATLLGWQTEWKEPFNINNIPANIIDRAFNLELGRVSGIKQNQSDLETEFPITVRYFRKGFRDPYGVLDEAVASADSYVRTALKHSRRLVGEGIKNVRLQGIDWERFDSNDNLIIVRMEFTALVILAVD